MGQDDPAGHHARVEEVETVARARFQVHIQVHEREPAIPHLVRRGGEQARVEHHVQPVRKIALHPVQRRGVLPFRQDAAFTRVGRRQASEGVEQVQLRVGTPEADQPRGAALINTHLRHVAFERALRPCHGIDVESLVDAEQRLPLPLHAADQIQRVALFVPA